MKLSGRLSIVLLALAALSCSADEEQGISIFSSSFDFSQDLYGWSHGFAEYPAGPDDSTYYELKYGYVNQPTGANSLMLSGNNRSGGLFMYAKRKLDGLTPNTFYTLTFNVSFTSNADIHGLTATDVASGENVFLKVGATAIEPKSVIDRNKYVMNIDKGSYFEDGTDMINIGNILSPSGTPYSVVTKTNSTYVDSPFRVKSNSRGEIWLVVGTDSGSTGVTTLYYSKIFVTLSATN